MDFAQTAPAHQSTLSAAEDLIPRGFSDGAAQSQPIFAALMQAFAHPGRPYTLATDVVAPKPLLPAAAAIVLALCDFETPVFLDAAARTKEVLHYVRFFASCPITDKPHDAQFALITALEAMPALTSFALGTLDFPDQSTTLILQLGQEARGQEERAHDNTPACRLVGPGIPDNAPVPLSLPLPDGFMDARAALKPLFPRGLDVIFVFGDTIIGLPRSTMVLEG